MSDPLLSTTAQRSISLVPGFIYEWTPEGTLAFDRVADTEIPPVGPPRTTPVGGSEIVAGYHLIERIGQGCTGEVWRAVGPGGVAVALKLIESQQRGARLELQSIASMQEVRHANLVTIFGIWEQNDWIVIGMDLADTTLLDQFETAMVNGKSGLDFGQLIDYLRQAARAIDFLNEPTHPAHGSESVGLMHRDIKPQNLLLVGGSVKVGDFGLVKRLDPNPTSARLLTEEGIESLITAYSAPEVRRGSVSRRSDQYSLAATYCHLRGGQVPSTPGGKLDRIDLKMLPPTERPAVARAMATDPAARWPSCVAFVEALAASRTMPAPRLERQVLASDQPRTSGPWDRLKQVVRPAIVLMMAASVILVLAWSQQPTLEPLDAEMQPPLVTTFPVPPEPPPPPDLQDSVVETVAIVQAEQPSPPPVVEPEPAMAALINEELEVPVMAARSEMEPGLSGTEIVAAIRAGATRTLERTTGQFQSARIAVQGWWAALPRSAPPVVPAPVPVVPPPPRTATIIVRMPSTKAELVVRGEVGRGNPDEWYGPRRIIHSPPITEPQEYLIGAFWTDPDGRPTTRSQTMKVVPGQLYEVDLRAEKPMVSLVSPNSTP